MSEIAFLLNGEVTRVADAPQTRTLLDWLREDRGLTGTKEGCNEGDCGACSVVVTDKTGSKSMNACILFLSQLHGRAVRTVEGISGPDGEMHPVQKAMVDHHGSQCGFCTPGFVTTMAAAHKNGQTDHNDQLAGNLCRCTGYAPIIRAAEAAAEEPVPDWMEEDLSRLSAFTSGPADPSRPSTTVEAAKWYLDHPGGTLIGGGTDAGLWVTKNLKDIGPVAFLSHADDLADITVTDDQVRLGAAATIADVMTAVAPLHPDFAELLRRYGSTQVRNAATIGGNIANASPIGDGPPALIALGATLHLRRGVERREILLEDFFIDYGKQDRTPGELVEAVSFPRGPDRLKCYKLSKRFDQDISAVCGCFNIRVIHGVVTSAKIAFGGMAGIPKRARAVEKTLIGKAWDENAADRSWDAFKKDFTPLSDMRASAEYRLEAARGMLMRYLLEDLGAETRVLNVRPVEVPPEPADGDTTPTEGRTPRPATPASAPVPAPPESPRRPANRPASETSAPLSDVASAAAAATAAAVEIASTSEAAKETETPAETAPGAAKGDTTETPAQDAKSDAAAKAPAKPGSATSTDAKSNDAPSDGSQESSEPSARVTRAAPDGAKNAAEERPTPARKSRRAKPAAAAKPKALDTKSDASPSDQKQTSDAAADKGSDAAKGSAKPAEQTAPDKKVGPAQKPDAAAAKPTAATSGADPVKTPDASPKPAAPDTKSDAKPEAPASDATPEKPEEPPAAIILPPPPKDPS